MTTASAHFQSIDERTYKRRIRAWTLYDWANSAFATTILAAVLPVYFSSVAGATLPSSATATAYWSLGLSVSLLIVAVLSPILGTISDIMRGKKLFLSIFAGIGIIGTAMLVLVGTGDWIMASAFAIIGRIGFNGSITFYDALLPHVAREEDQDRVSALGFAIGYLGGGVLLAINVAMIQLLPEWFEFAGERLSFLSVAVWWLIFTIPLFLRTPITDPVPEPPAATETLEPGETVVSAGFARLGETLRDLSRYRELFRYLIAFLIYNDGIGTIIGVAAIYATELGFGLIDTILALLLVQFVGVPFSLVFGRIANAQEQRRPIFLAFIVFNLILLPIVAISGRFLLPVDLSGAAPPPYESTATELGEGNYLLGEEALIVLDGTWDAELIPGEELRPAGLLGFLNDPFGGEPLDASYYQTEQAEAALVVPFNGQEVIVVHSTGPGHGIWELRIDGEVVDEINAYSDTLRYNESVTLSAEEPGAHRLEIVNTGEADPAASGTLISVSEVTVLPPARAEGFGVILPLLGVLIGVNLFSLLLAFVLGRPLFGRLVERIDTKNGIILALTVYAVVAVWGFFLDSTIEFWFIAWMIAMVQGGSQALSRSLYAAMSPASKSGEFFGLFSIMEKFASLFGPLVFAAAGFLLGNSRWGVLSLILFFLIGIVLLLGVNVEEGKRVAREEDRRIMGGSAP